MPQTKMDKDRLQFDEGIQSDLLKKQQVQIKRIINIWTEQV